MSSRVMSSLNLYYAHSHSWNLHLCFSNKSEQTWLVVSTRNKNKQYLKPPLVSTHGFYINTPIYLGSRSQRQKFRARLEVHVSSSPECQFQLLDL